MDFNNIVKKVNLIEMIASILQVQSDSIGDISILKKGMTNNSIIFSFDGNKYILRIPGEGTNNLINRKNEALVYKAISGYDLCDNPVYINSENGYKITKYLDDVRSCDENSTTDLKRCMEKLKYLHGLHLKVPHAFDVFDQIIFYENLRGENKSTYTDYNDTKDKVFSLKKYVDGIYKNWGLTHIDAVPDNFLFYKKNLDSDGENVESLQLTDWEYSGMQDPHLDIAMFILYCKYNKEEADRLIDIYFEGKCERKVRAKIYCYIAMGGLLWSNWCEYKYMCGVEFGEYSLRQYHYAKDYYRYAIEMISDIGK